MTGYVVRDRATGQYWTGVADRWALTHAAARVFRFYTIALGTALREMPGRSDETYAIDLIAVDDTTKGLREIPMCSDGAAQALADATGKAVA